MQKSMYVLRSKMLNDNHDKMTMTMLAAVLSNNYCKLSIL